MIIVFFRFGIHPLHCAPFFGGARSARRAVLLSAGADEAGPGRGEAERG